MVAIGDVHGSIDGLVEILRAAELIDDDNDWIGGTATLVQTGDVLDRGLHVREVMDLLIKVQEQAREQGGEVIALLGNHEAMNLLGFTRDVNPEVYALFAEGESEARQEKSYRDWVRFVRRRARVKGEPRPSTGADVERAWKTRYPVGYLEYLDALGPDGKYGRWLRSLPAIARVGNTAFMHGGISPELSTWSVGRINERVADEVTRFDRCRRRLLQDGVVHPITDPSVMAREGLAELEVLKQRLAAAPTTSPTSSGRRSAFSRAASTFATGS